MDFGEQVHPLSGREDDRDKKMFGAKMLPNWEYMEAA